MEREQIEKINSLIGEIQKSNLSAIEELHCELGSRLFFIAVKYLKDTFEAEDLVQDFWLNIQIYCSKYWFKSNGYSYLIKVFENTAKMRLRKLKRVPMPITQEDITRFEENKALEVLTTEEMSLRVSIRKATELMSENERKIFSLSLYEDKTIAEIAKELSIPRSTAQRIKQKAYFLVKEKLIEDGWDKSGI